MKQPSTQDKSMSIISHLLRVVLRQLLSLMLTLLYPRQEWYRLNSQIITTTGGFRLSLSGKLLGLFSTLRSWSRNVVVTTLPTDDPGITFLILSHLHYNHNKFTLTMKSNLLSWSHFLMKCENATKSLVISGVQRDKRTGTFTFISSQIVLSGGTTCAIRGTTFRNASDMCHVIVYPCKNFIKEAFNCAKICRTNGHFINSFLHGSKVYELTGPLLTVPMFIVLNPSVT